MEEMIVFIVFTFITKTSGGNFQLCLSNLNVDEVCSDQVLGDHNSEDATSCDVKFIAPHSPECRDSFSSPPTSIRRLGQITIKPFILQSECIAPNSIFTYNHSVPNVIFTDIKWKKLNFRIAEHGAVPSRHCRSLTIRDNVTVDHNTELHYDCYKSITDGSLNSGTIQVLDVEATDGNYIDQRQFMFYLPAIQMLGASTNESVWKPFVYVENMVTSTQLRIVPPPSPLNITYQIEVIKISNENAKSVANRTKDEVVAVESVAIKSLNGTLVEEIYDYTPTLSGSYYFVVTTIQGDCMSEIRCNSVKSPVIALVTGDNKLPLYLITTASVLVSAMVMWILYRHYSRRPSEIPKPPKVLVIYPSENTIHAECVKSFVEYLRSECGFDISYDGDIQNTTHCDPYYWAEDVIREATHIMYIVGPKFDRRDISENFSQNALYNVDKLLLSFLKAIRALQTKNVMNLFFEHSDGVVPIETRNDRVFYLLNDWQKLIAYLSKDLLPKKQIMRTERGKSFIADLTRVKKLLNGPSVV